jgi:hypothetical protein
MYHEISMPFHFSTPLFVVVNFVCIEGESGESKECHWSLIEISNMFAFWERHFHGFGGRSAGVRNFWAKYPIPTIDKC